MSTKLSSCCLSGHIHEGTPQGEEETVGGLPAYVTGSDDKHTVLVFITDVFGYKLPNVRLAADEYAQAGDFQVVVPDFFGGDYVKVEHMTRLTPLRSGKQLEKSEQEAEAGKAFADVGPWLERQKDSVVQPRIRAVIEELHGKGKKIGIVGFCWGGRQAILAADPHVKIVSAVVANHPSFTEFPKAFEAVAIPVCINVGTDDSLFPNEQVHAVKNDIWPTKKGCEFHIYDGAVHGFTIRSDHNVDKERKHKEEATVTALNFLKANL